ncbi:hypothetical protein [Rhodoferax fermentans]|uniref:Uncharacterized protein n=1 Tax=Rhodoferax fermentans TaxID=28066 RepID=A0A1T1ANM2_RHOFE|nr:hypothetical protein [Rhodoferax fermentans]OOV05746.1 hypothetical protein RF819_02635 [Rhodoferax fermentans]
MATLYPSTAPVTLYPGQELPPDYPVQNSPTGAATNVVRGLKGALLNVDAGAATSAYYKALAKGDAPRAKANGLRAQQLAEEAARAAPRVQSVGDIHGGADFADWGAGVMGGAPVSMVKPLAGGLAGAMAGARVGPGGAALGGLGGAAAGMQPDMRDAARLQQMQAEQQGAPQLPAQQVLDDTNSQGWAQAGVESLVPGLAARSLVGAGTRAALTHPLRAAATRVGRDVALDSGAAAVSEGVAMNFETGRDANRDTSGDTMRYIDAAASEAVPGVGYGALGHAGDVAHGALGGTLDAAGKGGAYAARLAEQGGAAGAAKAKELWDNRPKTMDEAAVAVGEGAAKLHNQAEDAVTRLAQRGKDPDVDVLLTKRTDKSESAMRADDLAKHQAATNFIAKNQANTGALPEYVQAAMADYAAKPQGPFGWEPLADAVNDMHRAQGIGEAYKRFTDEAALKLGEGSAKLMNSKDNALAAYSGKRAADGRANAQTPDMQFDIEAARDDLSPLLDEALAPLTGLKSQDALDNVLPSLNYALRTWVENNFSMKKDGEPVVPNALLNMFTDPAKAVQATVDLLHRQGLVDDSLLPLRDRVLEQLQVKQLARQQAGMIIDDMLVPTKAKGLTAVDHDLIAEDLMDRLQRDKVSTAEAKALFGPRARVAIDALWAKINAARPKDAEVETEQGGTATRTGYDEGDSVLDGEDDGSGDSFEELDQMTNARDPSQDKADTRYHAYNPRTKEPFKVGGFSTSPETGEVLGYHDEKAPLRIADLQAKSGGEVKRIGYMDYLREKHGNDSQALIGDAIGFLQSHEKEIRTLTDKYIAEGKKAPRAEDVVNKNWYMLKETAGRKGEGTDATVASLGRESAGGKIMGNEWAERSDGEHGTVKEGRIWLERELSDGRTVAFATSTGRIVSRMATARKGDGKVDESNGLAGQVTLLRQGLASLLSASYNAPGPGKYGKSLSGKSGKGEPVLTGRVGYKPTADSDIVWLAEGDDFPDNLRMHSSTGQTYAQAKAAAKTQRDDELVAWAKRQLEKLKGRVADSSDRGYKGAMMDLQRMQQALKKPDLDELDQLRREGDYRKEKERESRKPVGADTKETQRATLTTAIDTNNRGEKFATKKDALEYARDKGDRVVKRAGHWIIERTLPYSETKNTGLPTEISEMGKTTNVRSRAEDGHDNKPRNVDELTGEALHTDKRETAAAKSDRDALAAKADAAAAVKETRAQRTAFLLDALRKGIPAFNEMAHKLSPERRAALLDHLKVMVEAKTADNPIWGGAGRAPKDIEAFAKRARAALVSLGAMQAATKVTKAAAKPEAPKPVAAPTQKFGDVVKKMMNYIKNPPDDYNVKQLEAIRDWATKQEARLKEEAAKVEHSDSDRFDKLDDMRFEAVLLKAEAVKAIANEAVVEAHHAEHGGPRYNAMATRIHTDLGREGFAATHDSPIRHEGKFDWRSHIGKGEGHASFGAGTYLSTSDGVHKGYKSQFTAKIRGEEAVTDAAFKITSGYSGEMEIVEAVRGLPKGASIEAVRAAAIKGLLSSVDDEISHEIVQRIKSGKSDAHLKTIAEARTDDTKSPTYEVSVDIKPEQLLDWNKPLSEQSALVQKALSEVMARLKGYDEYKDPTGEKLYHYIEDISGGDPGEVSDYLQSRGILGHKYAAAGGKNDTHPNYVIYDDAKITTNYVHFNKQAADPAHGAFGTAPAPSAEEQAKFHADILRRLGPQMKAVLEEELWGKTKSGKQVPISGQWTKGLIQASVYARNLGQIGAHESFHELFSRLRDQPQAEAAVKILDRAASSQPVLRQLQRLLDGETRALAQIKDGAPHAAEERMAYMFQFHQAGLLKIGPETETVFQKIARVLRRVAGLMNDDERADLLLRSFDAGHMQDADAAARVLANSVTARQHMYESVNTAFKPVLEKASRLVNTAETNLERQGIKEYHDIRRLFKRSVGEDGAQGYLDAKDHLMKQKSNELFKAFQDANGEDYKPADLALAAKYLHTGKKPTDPVVKDIVAKLTGPDGILPRMHQYLKDAGVMRWEADPVVPGKGEWVPMGKIDEKYFPRAYNTAAMVTNPDAFVADLLTHNNAELSKIAAEQNELLTKSGATDFTPTTPDDIARGITNRLINSFGSELDENSSAVGFSPVMQAVNRRTLHWLAPEVLEKWGEKDVAKVMTSYIAQGIKRAEYVRRFGNGGEKLQTMLKDAHDNNVKRLVAKGMSSDEAKAKALKVAKGAATDVMALEGTLGYDIKPGMRRFQNSLLVYENMRLLSTSLFSQFIDPLGIVVRGGTMADAWTSYKRGIREVIASIKGDPIKDLDAQIADQVGTTDANGFLAAFGQLYSSQYMGDKFRKANDVLFKYNGMEGFNRGMQVSATRAAINFIKRHATQPNDNSVSFLKELNLTAKDVVVDAKTGELDYTDPKIQQAIHQWVNGAIMRPNAAQRPAWGSDPHYMVFWHMKQFAYTFHDVIMKRAVHDYKKYGDMGPVGTLLMAYTPVMIATDALKGVLLTGGDEPGWMRAGLGSEIEHGAMRAGLMGKFQPGADVLGPNRSFLGLGGPAVEQLTQMFDKSPLDSAINALPGANVWNTMKGGAMVEMQGED